MSVPGIRGRIGAFDEWPDACKIIAVAAAHQHARAKTVPSRYLRSISATANRGTLVWLESLGKLDSTRFPPAEPIFSRL